MAGTRKKLLKADLDNYKKQLEILRKELLEEYKKLSKDIRDEQGEGGPSGHSNSSLHLADAATDAYDRTLSLNLASNEMEIVSEIEHALRKIEEKTYGVCEGSDKPIPKARLDALPYVRYTREYQEELEKNGGFDKQY